MSSTQFELQRKRADNAFIKMLSIMTNELALQGVILPDDSITLIDIGSGSMQYGFALERWANQKAERVRIIAIDGDYTPSYYFHPRDTVLGQSSIEQLPGHVEEALPMLKRLGVEKIDLATLFNPDLHEPFPNISSLDELCRFPVIGVPAFTSDKEPLTARLNRQGYRVKFIDNPVAREIAVGPGGFNFTYYPMFVAIPQ